MRVDLKDDRFDVTHDPELIAVETMLEAVRKVGYTPEVAAANVGVGETHTFAAVDVSRLPEPLRALFQRAGQAEKLVLLRFTGPG